MFRCWSFTHNDHDFGHEPGLAAVADCIDYLWSYAEEQGIADRMTVLISSDFGRTPHYNSTNGKDHWPINSMVIMEKNAPWGNRVVGLTDEGHNAYKINPTTLLRDDLNGTNIYPKHIHQALRTYLGIDSHPLIGRFQFSQAENFDFFNPDLQTAGRDSDPRNSIRFV